jgi:hypothetical protein
VALDLVGLRRQYSSSGVAPTAKWRGENTVLAVRTSDSLAPVAKLQALSA